MHCQKMYDQIIVTDWVQSNIKPINIKIANILTKFDLPSFQTISISTNISRPRLRNTSSPLTNKKELKLMKKEKCFYY